MFNINGYELLIIGIVAVLVIGPQRLPEYVQKLKDFIRQARTMANNAREQLKEESGVDLDTVDWQKYNPRNYDPRQILRDALLEDDPMKAITAAGLVEESAAEKSDQDAAKTMAPEPQRLVAGQRAPWDTEAT